MLSGRLAIDGSNSGANEARKQQFKAGKIRGIMMSFDEGHLSPSGVLIANDFRSNLIIDRYDPVFADMRASKLKHLKRANSEDAVTWNVFRSLRQIRPEAWLPDLWRRAFPDGPVINDWKAVVRLWETIPPPLGLLTGGDEGDSEIDIVIEAPTWLWFIEAKYRSDISLGTTTRPDRDQVIRNLDVGSYHAGVRQFFFSLLTVSEKYSPKGVEKVREYTQPSVLQTKLGHRPDGLKNIKAVRTLVWTDLVDVLVEASKRSELRDDERAYATRAFDWLKERGFQQSAV